MAKHIEIIARGVWRSGGRILLCRNVAKGYFYLPGGHVEPGETAATALARELLEETGETPEVGQPLAIAECLFEHGGRPRHEINLLFHVEHSGPPPAIRAREAEIDFQWVNTSEIGAIDLRPARIRHWLVRGGPDLPGITWIDDT